MTTAPPAYRLQLAAWRTLQATRGEKIEYHVHDLASLTVCKAVLTQPKTNRVDITDAVGFESRRWHWLIDPNDLVLPDGTVVVPAHGHWIIRGQLKYIITPDNNDLVWRWSDASQIWRRVFCQEA
jgi:hypothetical protein